MIPYELIVTSAGRPHLLKPTLESLLEQVDQRPSRILIHNDQVFDTWDEIKEVVRGLDLPLQTKVLVTNAHPPRRLGLAIHWLMANVTTDYVLYSQDDFVTVRPVPIAKALWTMGTHDLHHIRFNKRATMEFKETWNGRWYKEERTFQLGADGPRESVTLTVSDHWYFQLGLWRASEMQKSLDFWTESDARHHRLAVDEPEGMLNHFFDLHYGGDPLDCWNRARHHRTFIWGPIGEDRYIRHIGGNKEDWAGDHPRAGAADDQATAWREIQSYKKGPPDGTAHSE